MKKRSSLFAHSYMMVLRNFKSYILLSVTITLSFSFLLAFFVLSDSNIYNKYKEIFSVSPNIMNINGATIGYSDAGDDITTERYQLLINRLQKMKDTYFYQYFETQLELTHYQNAHNHITASITYVPNNLWGIYNTDIGGFLRKVKLISGSQTLNNKNEVIIDQNLYRLLASKDSSKPLTVKLPIVDEDGIYQLKEFKVVGVVEALFNPIKSQDSTTYYVRVYVSQALAKSYNSAHYSNRNILVYSPNILEVRQICKELSLGNYAPIEYQITAKKEIQNQINLNSITAMILFVLLGINLYSSFKNALNERCFEIGVKRAIGAKKKNIIYQFFFEGLIVMLANILFSILLVTNLLVAYKFIQHVFYDTEWIVNISSYSVIIYIFCAVFLSVSYSFVFAYQSTEVEIIRHLKAE